MTSATPRARRPRIALLTTGGTIAMADHGDGARPALSGTVLAELLGDEVDVSVTEVFAKPSPNLTLSDMALLARAAERAGLDCDGVVIAHGTDTLEETAWCLDLLLHTARPVVVTGAMRTADAIGADGGANLRAACTVAASPAARGHGVLVVLADEIHAAQLVRKTHSSKPQAFSSTPFGPIGEVAEGRVRLLLSPTQRPPTLSFGPARACVPIVHVHSGMDVQLLTLLAASDLDGLVLSLPGGGHAPESLVSELAALAGRLPVVFSGRGAGDTLSSTYGYAGGEMDLIARGLIPSGPLDAVKARIATALLASSGAGRDQVADFFASL